MQFLLTFVADCVKILIRIGDGVLSFFAFIRSFPLTRRKKKKSAVIFTAPKAKRLQFHMPRITLPHFTMPHITLPRFTMPRLSLPHIPVPRVTLPHISFPKISAPHITLPHIKLPHVAWPHITLPHVSLPARAKPAKQPKRAKKRARFFLPLSFFVKFKYFTGGVLFSLLFLFIPCLIFLFLQDLPSPKSLAIAQIPQTTKIYDRNGVLLYQIYADQNRTIVPLSNVPDYLTKATIAIEDKDFYHHPGFDVTAIIRSTVGNAQGRDLQGGSTITQQLIKSTLLTPETSFKRKIKEVILAFWAERLYTKNQILEMYFNQVSYGGTTWGVESAAQVYFGKHVKDLDLAQSAFLAGVPRAPTIYTPYGTTPTAWKKRQKEVLARMVALNYITRDQANKADAEALSFLPPQSPIHAPHFVMYIKDLLTKKYGLSMVERGGLIVTTSLDTKLQDMAQGVVSEEVAKNGYLNLTNGAAVVTNPDNGDILAMIGSHDFNDPLGGNVNVAVAMRQPGSSIKVVTYAAGLAQGMTAASIIDDSPTNFSAPGVPPYTPVNYDGKFHGRVPLRIALANSFNIPAVKTLRTVGIPTMVDLAKNMGMKSWGSADNYGLSITLGSAEATMLDMATIYGTLANMGEKVELNPILKITDYKGNVIEEKTTPARSRALDEGVAYIMADILSDNQARSLEFGSNSPLVVSGHTVPVKTGTSDNKRDNWTIGYTKHFLTAVWVGNNDGQPMSQSLASGITGAAPIWNRIMSKLLADKPDDRYIQPENVVQKSCLGRNEYFVRGTENNASCIPPRAKPTTVKTAAFKTQPE